MDSHEGDELDEWISAREGGFPRGMPRQPGMPRGKVRRTLVACHEEK